MANEESGKRRQRPTTTKRGTRERLIGVARKLCTEGKFLRLSTEEIAKSANLSRAGFYLNFKSKEDLLHAVLVVQLEWYIQQHNTMSTRRASTIPGLVSWFNQFVEGYRNAGELMMLFWISSPAKNLIQSHQRSRLRGVEVLGHRLPDLRIFRDDGSIDPDRHREVLFFVYMLEQVCFNVAFGGEADSKPALETLARHFTQLMHVPGVSRSEPKALRARPKSPNASRTRGRARRGGALPTSDNTKA
jgi:AcrR family transcriptional regulator